MPPARRRASTWRASSATPRSGRATCRHWSAASYRDLPGSVYTKGFLRNYGLYLGLDPEYLIDLYRLESSAAPRHGRSGALPPRPITTRRSWAFVLTPGAVFAALLTVAVAAFIFYIGTS